MTTHNSTPGSQLRTQRITPFTLEPSYNLVRGECTSDFSKSRLDSRVGCGSQKRYPDQVIERLLISSRRDKRE
jgi:hypothetical protein